MSSTVCKKYIYDVFPLLFLLGTSMFLLSPVILQDKTFFAYTDNSEQFYAWYQKLSIAIHHGYFPLWNANVYGGHCFAGEFQTAIFYPLNLIWVILFGSKQGIDIYYLEWLVIIHFYIASIGMYFVLKKFKLSTIISIIGGLIFAYTGCVASRALGQTAIFFGLTLTPFTFLFIVKAQQNRELNCKKQKIFLILSGAFLGMQILAGHIQPAFHSILLIIFYFIYENYSKYENVFNIVVSSINTFKYVFVSMLVFALPQLYLGYRYMHNAYRWVSADAPISSNDKIPYEVFANKFNVHPNQIVNLISRSYSEISDGNDIYLGLFPMLVIMLYVVLKYIYKQHDIFDHYKFYFIALLLVSFLIMLGGNTFVPVILYHIPGFTMVRQLGRYAILFHFSLTCIFSFALFHLSELSINLSTRPKRIGLLFLLGIGTLFIFYYRTLTSIVFQDILINISAVLIFLFLYVLLSNNKSIRSVTILFCFLGMLFLTTSGIYSNKSNAYYPLEYFKNNKFYDYLKPLYGSTRVIVDTDKLPKNVGDVYPIQTKLGYSATMNKNYFDFICQDWAVNSKVNDLLNIKYIISADSLNLPIVLKDDSLNLKLYYRSTALNRLFLMSTFDSTKFSGDRNRFVYKKIVYNDVYQAYETHTLKADTLVFSENFYFGWKAYVDGERVELFNPSVNGFIPLLMSIPLPEGRHKIELKYNSLY